MPEVQSCVVLKKLGQQLETCIQESGFLYEQQNLYLIGYKSYGMRNCSHNLLSCCKGKLTFLTYRIGSVVLISICADALVGWPLLCSFTKSWKLMVDSHETQRQIMFEVNSFTCPAYGKFCNDAQRHATLKLEAELRNWRSCFISYVNAQRAYMEALDGWLSKFILTDTIRYSRGISSIAPDRAGAPTLVVICHDWYATLCKLPNKRVSFTMRNFLRSVRVLWLKQGEEQQQKRKVDSLSKELDKKLNAYKRAENRIIGTKLLEHKPEIDAKQRMEHLSEKKEMLNVLRKRIEMEKAKHQACMRDTHDVTLNGFKIGLASIFESLTEFSKDLVKLYEDLLTQANAKDSEKATAEKRPCVEGPYSHIAVDAS